MVSPVRPEFQSQYFPFLAVHFHVRIQPICRPHFGTDFKPAGNLAVQSTVMPFVKGPSTFSLSLFFGGGGDSVKMQNACEICLEKRNIFLEEKIIEKVI